MEAVLNVGEVGERELVSGRGGRVSHVLCKVLGFHQLGPKEEHARREERGYVRDKDRSSERSQEHVHRRGEVKRGKLELRHSGSGQGPGQLDSWRC